MQRLATSLLTTHEEHLNRREKVERNTRRMFRCQKIQGLLMLMVACFTFWVAWVSRHHSSEQHQAFFTKHGLIEVLVAIAMGVMSVVVYVHGPNFSIRKNLRAAWLESHIQEMQYREVWGHISVNTSGGLVREATPSTATLVDGMTWAKFAYLMSKIAMNLWFSVRNFSRLPEYHHSWLGLARGVVVCTELLVTNASVLWCAYLVTKMVFSNTKLDKGRMMLSFANYADFASGFSCLKMLGYVSFAESFAKIKSVLEKHWKMWEVSQMSLSCRVLKLIIRGLWEVGGKLLILVLGLYGVVVKLRQVAFVFDLAAEEWGGKDFLALVAFSNNLSSIRDVNEAKKHMLARALRDPIDLFIAGTDAHTHGSRFHAWHVHLVAKMIGEIGATNSLVAVCCALDAAALSKFLLDVRSFSVGDRVVAVDNVAVPADTMGILLQVEPVPIVQWETCFIPRKVELRGFKVDSSPPSSDPNGVYVLRPAQTTQQDGPQRAAVPSYWKQDDAWILVPNWGRATLPRAYGWQLLKMDGKVKISEGGIWSTVRRAAAFTKYADGRCDYRPDGEHTWSGRSGGAQCTCTMVEHDGEVQLLWAVILSELHWA